MAFTEGGGKQKRITPRPEATTTVPAGAKPRPLIYPEGARRERPGMARRKKLMVKPPALLKPPEVGPPVRPPTVHRGLERELATAARYAAVPKKGFGLLGKLVQPMVQMSEDATGRIARDAPKGLDGQPVPVQVKGMPWAQADALPWEAAPVQRAGAAVGAAVGVPTLTKGQDWKSFFEGIAGHAVQSPEEAVAIAQAYLVSEDEVTRPSATGNQMRRFLGLPQRGVSTLLEDILAPISYPARLAEAGITAGAMSLPEGFVFDPSSAGLERTAGALLLAKAASPELFAEQQRMRAAAQADFNDKKQAYQDMIAKHGYEDVFNVSSQLGYTMVFADAAKVKAITADLDNPDLTWYEFVRKHEDLGVEVLFQSAFDPFNLIPVSWFEKAFEAPKAVQTAARGIAYGVKGVMEAPPVAKGLGKLAGFFTEVSAQTRLRAFSYTVEDTLTTLLSRRGVLFEAGEGTDIIKLIERAVQGDETILRALGPQQRDVLKRIGDQWNALGLRDVRAAVKRYGDELSQKMMDEPQYAKLLAKDDAMQIYVVERMLTEQQAKVLGISIETKGVLSRPLAFMTQLLKENYLATWAYKVSNGFVDNPVKMTLRGYNPAWSGSMTNPERVAAFLWEQGFGIPRGIEQDFTMKVLGIERGVLATERLPWPIGSFTESMKNLEVVATELFGSKVAKTADALKAAFAESRAKGLLEIPVAVMDRVNWANLPVLGPKAILESSGAMEITARMNTFAQGMLKYWDGDGLRAVQETVGELTRSGMVPEDALTFLWNRRGTPGPGTMREWMDRYLKVPEVAEYVPTPTANLSTIFPWAEQAPESEKLFIALERALDIAQARGAKTEELLAKFDTANALIGHMKEIEERALKASVQSGVTSIKGPVPFVLEASDDVLYRFDDALDAFMETKKGERWEAMHVFQEDLKARGLDWAPDSAPYAAYKFHDQVGRAADKLLDKLLESPGDIAGPAILDQIDKMWDGARAMMRATLDEAAQFAVDRPQAVAYMEYADSLDGIMDAANKVRRTALDVLIEKQRGRLAADAAASRLRTVWDDYTTMFKNATRTELPPLAKTFAQFKLDEKMMTFLWESPDVPLRYMEGGMHPKLYEIHKLTPAQTRQLVHGRLTPNGTIAIIPGIDVPDKTTQVMRWAQDMLDQGISPYTPTQVQFGGQAWISPIGGSTRMSVTRPLIDVAYPARTHRIALVYKGDEAGKLMVQDRRLSDVLKAPYEALETWEEVLRYTERMKGGSLEDALEFAETIRSHGIKGESATYKGAWYRSAEGNEWVFTNTGMHPSSDLPESATGLTHTGIELTVYPNHTTFIVPGKELTQDVDDAVGWMLTHGADPDTPIKVINYGAQPLTNARTLKEFVDDRFVRTKALKATVEMESSARWPTDLRAVLSVEQETGELQGPALTGVMNALTGEIRWKRALNHIPTSDVEGLQIRALVAGWHPTEFDLAWANPDLEKIFAKQLLDLDPGMRGVIIRNTFLGWTASVEDVATGAGRGFKRPVHLDWTQALNRLNTHMLDTVMARQQQSIRWGELYSQLGKLDDVTERTLGALGGWKAKAEQFLSQPPVPVQAAPKFGAADVAAARARVQDAWLEQLENARIYGEMETEGTLFHYWKNSRAGEILGNIFPFTKWQLRNPGFWARTFMERPALLADAYRVDLVRRRIVEDMNLTDRFNETLPMPVLQALADKGILPPGYWAFNPLQVLSIFGQIREPFETPQEAALTGAAGVVKGALNVAETFGMQPWPWWKAAARSAGLYPGEPPPSVLGALGRYPPWGTELERMIARQATGGPTDMDVYRVNRRLAEMVQEGTISAAQATAARDNQTHPLWMQAQREVNYVNDVTSGMRVFEPFTTKYASPGELGIRRDLKTLEGITDPIEQQRFLMSHPHLQAYWASQKPKLTREYDREKDLIFERWQREIDQLYPWDPGRKELYKMRADELRALEDKYVAQGLQLKSEPGDIRSGSDVMQRLRDMEPRPDQFTTTSGDIDWARYDAAMSAFTGGIGQASAAMGYPITPDQYDIWRTGYKKPMEQAWMLQQRAINRAWDISNQEFERGGYRRLQAMGGGSRFEVAAKLAPERQASAFASAIAARLGRPVQEILKELEGVTLPGAGTALTEEQKLQAEYYALELEERERFRVHFDVPPGVKVSDWLDAAEPDAVEEMLAEFRSDPSFLLRPTARQAFWGSIHDLILNDAAYDDPVLGAILSRTGRSTLSFTQEQYDAALKYLKQPDVFDRVVNVDRMDEANAHPDWWQRAKEQQEQYQLVTGAYPKERTIEQQYFLLAESQRARWQRSNPEAWKALTDYWDVKSDAKFTNPYYAYFYDYSEYTRWFGGRNPADVQAQITGFKSSWDAARRDMDMYNRGVIKVWTPAMEQWFGKRTAVSDLWDFIFTLPPGYGEWHKQLQSQEAYKVVMQLQSMKRTDWVDRIPDATAQKALSTLKAWVKANPYAGRPDTLDYWTRERGMAVPPLPEEYAAVRDSRALWKAASEASDWDAMDELLKKYGALWHLYGYYTPRIGSYRPKDESGSTTGDGGDGGTPGSPAPPPPPPPPSP